MIYINLLTCTDTKNDVKEVGRVFNGIQLEEKRCSFSLYGSISNTEKETNANIHFIMTRLDENYNNIQYTVLGSLSVEFEETMDANYTSQLFKFPLKDMPVPGIGKYKILAYHIDEKETIDNEYAEKILENEKDKLCAMYVINIT